MTRFAYCWRLRGEVGRFDARLTQLPGHPIFILLSRAVDPNPSYVWGSVSAVCTQSEHTPGLMRNWLDDQPRTGV